MAKAAASKVKPIPDGYYSITPHIVVKDAAAAIEFYKKAFNATECFRMPAPDGSVMHAEIKIGNSVIMMAEENPDWGSVGPKTIGGTPVTMGLYTEDTDATYKQACKAGAQGVMEPDDAFWGDRYARVTDPFGHSWSIMTHKEDLAPEEIQKRAAAMFQQQS